MAYRNPVQAFSDFAGSVGRRTIEGVNHYLELCAFAWRMILQIFRWPREGRSLLYRVLIEQIYFTAVQALWILIPVALLLGSSLILQFSRISGEYDLGKILVIILIRELGPIATALIVILRSATAMTIETGYMKVLHEMEALEMSGVDPVRLYAVPRLIGISTAMVCLVFIFGFTAILGGYALVWVATNVPLQNFLNQIGKALTPADFVVSALKAFFFGVAITVVSLFRGFTVGKSMTEVPVATSKGAVECVFYCMVISAILSILFYL